MERLATTGYTAPSSDEEPGGRILIRELLEDMRNAGTIRKRNPSEVEGTRTPGSLSGNGDRVRTGVRSGARRLHTSSDMVQAWSGHPAMVLRRGGLLGALALAAGFISYKKAEWIIGVGIGLGIGLLTQ